MTIFSEMPRLILRDWDDSDFPAFAEMNADPRVMEFFLKCQTKEESLVFFQKIREEILTEGFGLFALERKTDQAFLGFVGLHRCHALPEFSPCVEISWRLRPDFWGEGYAVEAAERCLELGFSAWKINEIVAFTSLPNVRSRRVMEKLKMHFIKEFDHPAVPQTHPLRRHVLFQTETNDRAPV